MRRDVGKKSKLPATDQDMAQATFAAILAAQKGDDTLAGEILREMADSMMGRYGKKVRRGKSE